MKICFPESAGRYDNYFFQQEFLYSVAQGTFNDGCWKHHTCNIILLCRRYSEGKWRKLAKTKKEEKQERGWENTNLFSFFSLPNFSLYCNHKISAIYTADCIYKSRHMIIQSFGPEGTPGRFFIYSSAVFHTNMSGNTRNVSSHRWRTIAL